MTREVYSVAPDAHPSVAAQLMVDYRVTPLPAVEANTLIGVISHIDLLLRRLHEFEKPLQRED